MSRITLPKLFVMIESNGSILGVESSATTTGQPAVGPRWSPPKSGVSFEMWARWLCWIDKDYWLKSSFAWMSLCKYDTICFRSFLSGRKKAS